MIDDYLFGHSEIAIERYVNFVLSYCSSSYGSLDFLFTHYKLLIFVSDLIIVSQSDHKSGKKESQNMSAEQ